MSQAGYGPSAAVGPRNNVPAGPPSHRPWASNPNSSAS